MKELNEDELKKVSGGVINPAMQSCMEKINNFDECSKQISEQTIKKIRQETVSAQINTLNSNITKG